MNPKKIRYINLDTFKSSGLLIDTYKFDFNCRFICNYLSKEVRKLKIIGDGSYKMISVTLCNAPSECKLTYGAVYPDVLSIPLQISEEEQIRYNNMVNLNDRYEFYLQLLEKGYTYASQFIRIPIKDLIITHDSLRNNNYENNWLWKRKSFPSYGIYALFKCYFTTFEFRLEIEVYRLVNKQMITKGIVLRTGPDEIFFNKKFRDIEVRNDILIIKDFLNKDRFIFNLPLLAQGIYNIKDLDYSKYFSINHLDLINKITW